MSRGVTLCGKVKPVIGGAEAKASLNRALSPSGDLSQGVDPKPGELPMARAKRE